MTDLSECVGMVGICRNMSEYVGICRNMSEYLERYVYSYSYNTQQLQILLESFQCVYCFLYITDGVGWVLIHPVLNCHILVGR